MNKGNKVPVRGKFKAFFCFVRKKCILLCSSVSLLTAELSLVGAGSVIFLCSSWQGEPRWLRITATPADAAAAVMNSTAARFKTGM